MLRSELVAHGKKLDAAQQEIKLRQFREYAYQWY